jgi:hypothetical protein
MSCRGVYRLWCVIVCDLVAVAPRKKNANNGASHYAVLSRIMLTSFLLCLQVLLSTLFWNILDLCSFHNMEYQVSHPCERTIVTYDCNNSTNTCTIHLFIMYTRLHVSASPGHHQGVTHNTHTILHIQVVNKVLTTFLKYFNHSF